MWFDRKKRYEAKAVEEIRARKAKYRSRQSRLKRYMAISMTAVLVFTAVYALILNAITLENNTASTMPGIVLEENENGDSVEVRELTPDEETAPAEAAEEDSYNLDDQPVVMGGDLVVPAEEETPAAEESQLAENADKDIY